VLRRVVNATGARGLYYDTRALLRDIRSTYNPVLNAAEMDVLRPVMDAELLVLDDLGAERPT
jgi:DNA replication protein DnaC